MILNPEKIGQSGRYKITTGVILPRPIAWVSSKDLDGRHNVAPYSFFTVASTNPLTLIFCPQQPAAGQIKDSLRNIEATGEFVINIVDEATAEAMNLTAATLEPGESEFEFAGLTAEPSATVGVPRVKESPAAFECRLDQIVRIGDDEPGSGAVVFGRVTSIYLREDVYQNSYIDLERLRPIGRLMGSKYTRVSDIFSLVRPQI